MTKYAKEATVQDIILECGPVRLVPFKKSDLRNIQEFLAKPRIVHCSSLFDVSPENADEFLSGAEESMDIHGFSRWKVISSDNVFLGWAGFAAFEETSEIELGYCLSRDAMDGAPDLPERICKALSEWFFDNTYFSHLVAMVRTDNKPAREVLHTSGFGYRESRRIAGMPCDVFQLFSPAMQTYVLTA